MSGAGPQSCGQLWEIILPELVYNILLVSISAKIGAEWCYFLFIQNRFDFFSSNFDAFLREILIFLTNKNYS